MIDYAVDDNFDVILPLQKVTNKSDLLFQQVRLLLETWTYDFPYNITMGIPYGESIINGGDVDMTDIEVIYREKISALQYFQKMENFSISVDANRNITISFDVYSTENISQNFIVQG